ncbi:hypothetical protein QFZ97_008102 [Paraburkholderia youngii]
MNTDNTRDAEADVFSSILVAVDGGGSAARAFETAT